MTRSIFILALLTTLAPCAFSDLAKNPWKLPTSMEVQGKKLVLNGIGIRKAKIFFKVYAAGLYLPAKSSNPEDIKKMEGSKVIDLYFLRNVDKKDITKAWKEAHGMDQFTGEVSTLNSYMVDMKKNTHGMQFQVHDDGLVVKVGENLHPKIKNAAFAKAILNIYLGPAPPNKELKEGMLGKKI
ncbi:MAG: chalcone isomerase family protein [Bacteriovoracales bacterium]|nr:chalcone isomerase family protein [Bacteriovoracales bacterium]